MTTAIILNATMDQIIYQLAAWSNQDFVEVYLPFAQVGSVHEGNTNQLLGWSRHRLSKLGDLEGVLSSQTSDIFGDGDDRLIIDYQDLELNPESIKLIQVYKPAEASKTSPSLILFSLNQDTSSGIIKLLKDTNIRIIDYKTIPKDKATKDAYASSLSQIGQEYSQKLNLNLSPRDLSQVINNSSSYREIIDHLDFLSLTDNPSQYIKELIIEEKPMLLCCTSSKLSG
jgi:hypothetical protein